MKMLIFGKTMLHKTSDKTIYKKMMYFTFFKKEKKNKSTAAFKLL